MIIGRKRNRVTIQQQRVTYNAYNEPIITYEDVATVWAEIKPLAGREFWAAQQVNAEVTGEIRIRYRSGITPTMIVKFGSRVFEILSLYDSYERRQELVLRVKEVL